MNLLNKIQRIKVVTIPIAVLIFVFQIFPWRDTQSILPQKPNESSINDYVFILTLNTGLNLVNDNRQNLEIKTSTLYCYDKNDITPTAEITNYKKTYQGILSILQSYRSFLSTQFSTST